MSDYAPPADVSVEDWATTPPAVRALVQALLLSVEAQAVQLRTLEARLAALEERVTQTSRTSSRPPSSDPPSAPPRRRRTPSGRRDT